MTLAPGIAYEPIRTSYKPPRDAGAGKDSAPQNDFDDVVSSLKTPPAANKVEAAQPSQSAGEAAADTTFVQDDSAPLPPGRSGIAADVPAAGATPYEAKDALTGVLQQAADIFDALARDLNIPAPALRAKGHAPQAGADAGAKAPPRALDDLLAAAAVTPEGEAASEADLQQEIDVTAQADALLLQTAAPNATAEALTVLQLSAASGAAAQAAVTPALPPQTAETAQAARDDAPREAAQTKLPPPATAAAADGETAGLQRLDDGAADVIPSLPSGLPDRAGERGADRASDRVTERVSGRSPSTAVSAPVAAVAAHAQSPAQSGFEGGTSGDGEDTGKPIDVSAITRQTHLAPVGAVTQGFESVTDQIAARIAADVALPDGAEPVAARAPVADIERPSIRVFAAAGTETLSMTLKPEQLGTVHIHLRLTDRASLELRIEADTPQAVLAIRDDTDALVGRLGAAGYDIERVVVQSSPIDRGLNDGAGAGTGREQERENLQSRQQGSDGGSQGRRPSSDDFVQGSNGDAYAAGDQAGGSQRAGGGIFV